MGRRPGIRKTFARIALGGVAAALVLGFLAGVASQTQTFRSWLRQALLLRLNQALAGELRVGSLEGNLVRTLVLRDVRLRAEGRRVFAARRIEAHYDLASLVLGGALEIEQLTVDGCAFDLVEDARGWNVERLWPESSASGGSGLPVRLARLVVDDGALRVLGSDATWRLRDISLAGSGGIAAAEQTLAVDRLSFTLQGRGLRVEELAGRLRHVPGEVVEAEDVRLRTRDSLVAGTMRISDGGARGYQVRADATRLAASELQRLLGTRAPVTDLAGRLHARGPAGALRFALRLTSGAGKARAHGSLDLAHAAWGYDLDARVAGLDLAGLVGHDLPESDLGGTLRVAGRGDDPRTASATLALDWRDARLAGRALPDLSLAGSLAAGTAVIDATASSGGERAQVRATVEVPSERYDVELTASAVDPGRWLARPQLAGRVSGTLQLTGAGFDPWTTRGAARCTLAPSQLGAVAITSARAALRADAGRVTIETLTLASDVATGEASGTMTVAAPDATPSSDRMAGNVRYRVGVRDLRRLAALLGVTTVAGAATLRGTARGRPQDLALEASLRGEALAWGAIGTHTLEAEITGKGLGSGRARIEARARASGVQAYAHPLESVNVAGAWEARGAAATARVQLGVREEESRTHELSATATVTPEETRVAIQSGRVTIGGQRWQVQGVPTLALRREAMTIDALVLAADRGQVAIEGSLRRVGPLDLRLAVTGLELADVRANLGGTASAVARLTGSLAAPALAAELTVDDPRVEGVRYRSLVARVGLRDGAASADAELTQAAGRDLTLAATLPVRFTLAPPSLQPTGPIGGELRARQIDLAFVDPLVPQLSRVGGTLAGDLRLGGKLDAPEARGTIRVSRARAFVAPLGLTYDPIELVLRLDGTAATIERLHIASGRGTLEGGGTIGPAAIGPEVMARFSAQRFPLFATGLGRAAASGELRLEGGVAAPRVEGALATDELVLQIPEVLPSKQHPRDPTIVVIGSGAPAPSAPMTPGTKAEDAPAAAPFRALYERTAIDVQVAVRRNAWVRRSDANIELRGAITASKRPGGELGLAGEIESVRGWYSFMGSRFDLSEGRVVFGGEELSPRLEIVAKRRAGGYTVTALVGGTIEKPTLVLESEPFLEQADILSVIVFGRPASGLSEAESRGLENSAVSLAANYVAPQLRTAVSEALGVDDLTFETDVEGTSDERVSVGKYVAPDIFVSLAHRFGVRSVEELRVEYAITPRWSLETSADTLGRTGVDLFWKRRY